MIEVVAGLLFWSIVSGIVPIVNAEVLVVLATVAVASAGAPLVAAIATLGQMIAKTGLFFTARWAPERLPARARTALERGERAIEGRGHLVGGVVLVSAVGGLPPFYAVSLAAGALHVSWLTFFVLGSLGRAVRFGVIAWAAAHFGEAALDLLG